MLPQINTGVLILADGTPCIVYDQLILHVRNVEVGSDDYRVTLIGIGRITPEKTMEDLHMIPVVFRDA
jgi:hypothetical protein